MRRSLVTLALLLAFCTPTWGATSWDKVRKELYHSIIRVTTLGPTGVGTCTAWPINQEKRLYYTAQHCLDGRVELDGQEATVVKQDKGLDLAILRGIYGRKALVAGDPVKVGDEVAGYGWGLALDFPMFFTRPVLLPEVTIPQIPFNPNTLLEGEWKQGMSGGPVLDKKGRVVSMVQQGVKQYNVSLGRTLKVMRAFAGDMWK
jgi:hypothetical protein